MRAMEQLPTLWIYRLSFVIPPNNDYICRMRIFDSYQPGGHHFNKALLWEYDTDHIDFQKCRRLVATRVMEMGRLEDFYAAFDLYGGIDGFAKIAKEEVTGLDDRTLNFMCHAFNLKKEDTQCYKSAQLRKIHLAS